LVVSKAIRWWLISLGIASLMSGLALPSQGDGRKILEKHHGKWRRWEGQVVLMV